MNFELAPNPRLASETRLSSYLSVPPISSHMWDTSGFRVNINIERGAVELSRLGFRALVSHSLDGQGAQKIPTGSPSYTEGFHCSSATQCHHVGALQCFNHRDLGFGIRPKFEQIYT
jgi:hypothetical protein